MTVPGIPLHAIVETTAPADELAALPFDFDRYVVAEPRLRSARWLDGGGPHVGARAEIVAVIPYTVPLIGRVLGAPEAVATVTEWAPPRGLAASFEGKRFAGLVGVGLEPFGSGSRVTVDGVVAARSRYAGLALRPLTPLLAALATRAIERGVQRAAHAVTLGVV
jgi:hypothetical protein